MMVTEFRGNRAVIEVDLMESIILANAIGNDGETLIEHPILKAEVNAVLQTVAAASRCADRMTSAADA